MKMSQKEKQSQIWNMLLKAREDQLDLIYQFILHLLR